MKTFIYRARGFTLIELLIVIAIIAILSGILITNLAGSRAKSRDGKRVSDISQIQLALEQYFDRCQQYPNLSNGTTISGLSAAALSTISNGCPVGVNLGSFISQTPSSPTYTYDYATYTPNGGNGPTDYLLHTKFETNAAALGDSILNSNKLAWMNGGNAAAIPCYTPASTGPYDYCISSH